MSRDTQGGHSSSAATGFPWLNVFRSRAAIAQGYETDTPTGEPPQSALLTQICEVGETQIHTTTALLGINFLTPFFAFRTLL